jgi:Sel1 repeat
MKPRMLVVLVTLSLFALVSSLSAQGVDVDAIRKAADQGDAAAQTNLGNLYYTGQGVTKDYGQAAVWYRKAAEQGYADAQSNLADLYDSGKGVPQDHAQAEIWRQKAAEKSHAHDVNNTGSLPKEGQGAAQTYERAANGVAVPQQPAQPAAPQQPAQTAQPAQPTPAWEWKSYRRADYAVLKSESGNLTIILHFFKHEFDTFTVGVPDGSVAIKVKGSFEKERTKNKLPVTLIYDDGISVSKTWGAVQYSDALEIVPKDYMDKEFKLVMKSKKFTVSYTDAMGAVVTGVFNIGDISEQMKTHGVHFHKFGFGDALTIVEIVGPKG